MKKTITFLAFMVFVLSFLTSCKLGKNDCDDQIWYEDADGDGFGNPDVKKTGCLQPEGYVADNNDKNDKYKVVDVNPDHLLKVNTDISYTKVPCRLSNGSQSSCYRINARTSTFEHPMGPWCPTTINDDALKGGIWLRNGQVYDVDGLFLKHLATFYQDNTWNMFDDNGDINVVSNSTLCIDYFDSDTLALYRNFCFVCKSINDTGLSQLFTIPIRPVVQTTPTYFPPVEENKANIFASRGFALNGIEFSAPLPLNKILEAKIIAPLDDAGGHITREKGYHYHAAMGKSHSISQFDGHSPLIGYAMDGHGIYSRLDGDGQEPTDLDECRGHYDEVRGYHYHVDAPGNNNFIHCLKGAFAIPQ